MMPTAPIIGLYSGLNTLEEQAKGAVADYEGPFFKDEVSRLQSSVTNQLNEWRNNQWSNMLVSLDPGDQ